MGISDFETGDSSRPKSEICNLSIFCGVFPDACKEGKPISLLPISSKVIERIVNDHTNTLLSENNTLYKFLSAFRPNHSRNLFVKSNRQDIKRLTN